MKQKYNYYSSVWRRMATRNNMSAGSAKAKGREPKTGLGRVINFKLGCLDDGHVLIYADARSHL
jgi:hypothetical protein